jgi:hypothetical protein
MNENDKMHKMKVSKTAKSLLKKFGNDKIKSITICRKPLSNIFINILNILSFGELSKIMKMHNIGLMYHLWFEFEIDNCKLIVEKNNIINIRVLSTTNIIDETIEKYENITPIIANNSITLNEFLYNGLIKLGNKKFNYFIFPHINCQHWCYYLLKSNNIKISKNCRKFILQKIKYKKLNYDFFINKIISFFSKIRYIFSVEHLKYIIIAVFIIFLLFLFLNIIFIYMACIIIYKIANFISKYNSLQN